MSLLMALLRIYCMYLLGPLNKITDIMGITCSGIYYWHHASLLIGTTVNTSSYWHYKMNVLLLALHAPAYIIGTMFHYLLALL